MAVQVDDNKCTGCGICARICPMGAITIEQVAKIDTALCADCCVCVAKCPQGALRLPERMTMQASRASGPPAAPLPAKQNKKQPDTPRPSAVPAGFRVIDTGGILNRIFNFFGLRSGRGGRRGKGCGRGGHSRGRRGW
ncbi:MAG: 4Fe-4S binding protein [Deltaproteobacteria bacterium]|nr:4Fe-4S binding protein [Deltaproteobacteria bacterium]